MTVDTFHVKNVTQLRIRYRGADDAFVTSLIAVAWGVFVIFVVWSFFNSGF